jgi:soluble lytic murein transglycosylase-like protein
MPKLIRLLLVLLVLSGAYSYRWYNVPYSSISRHAFTKQEMDRFYERDRQDKIERRNTDILNRLFRAYGCNMDGGGISRYAAKYLQNLPARLVGAIIIAESTCNPEAVSSSGAIGLMQIMPEKRYTKDELRRPDRNIEIGTTILKNHIRQSGSIHEGLKRYYGDFPGNEEYAKKILNIARIN